MQVIELEESDRQQWDRYVYSSPGAGIYHLSGWKDVLAETFGLHTNYLLACNSSGVVGILPLVHVNSKLSGHYFTSMPGGVSAESEEAAAALIEQAIELVRNSKARYLVLRDSLRRWDVPGLVTDQSHCTLVTNLDDSPEQMWKRLDRRVRQHLRKAMDSGLEVVIGQQHLEQVYHAYAEAMRDVGTPTQGVRFFRHLLHTFPAQFTTIMVLRQGDVLGGAFVAQFRDTLYNTWGGMLHDSFALRSSHIWYWETMKYGHETGCRRLDLGRSVWNSGTYQFKKHWLSEPHPLFHQFYLNGPSRPPALGSRRGECVRYRWFARAWRLLPMPVTEYIGPFLRQRMPFG